MLFSDGRSGLLRYHLTRASDDRGTDVDQVVLYGLQLSDETHKIKNFGHASPEGMLGSAGTSAAPPSAERARTERRAHARDGSKKGASTSSALAQVGAATRKPRGRNGWAGDLTPSIDRPPCTRDSAARRKTQPPRSRGWVSERATPSPEDPLARRAIEAVPPENGTRIESRDWKFN